MSRTRVQQTQISGSLSSDILDNLAAGSALAAQSTLVGDLNAMRSQLNKIIGVGNWYDELAGTQDLADIQGAMQVTGADAAFQGDVSAVGELLAISGGFSVQAAVPTPPENGYLTYIIGSDGVDIELKPAAGDRTGVFLPGTSIFVVDQFTSPPQIEYSNVVSSTYNGSITTVTVATPLIGQRIGVVGDPAPPGAASLFNMGGPALLNMNGDASFSGNLSAVDGTFSGNVSAEHATLTGNLSAVDGFFSGDLSAVDATLTGNLSAVDGTFSGNVTAISGSFSAVSISGDVAQRLYIVDADGSMKDEANLTFDGSELAVTGNTTVSGDLSAIGGDFTVIAGGGNAEAGHLGYAGYIDGGGAAIQLSDALGNLSAIFPVGTPVAIYNSSDWSLAPVYFTSNGVAYFAGLGTMVTWVTSPAPAPFWGNDSVLVKVSDPAPAGASVLIQSSGGASSLSMNGNGSFTGDLSAVDATLSGDLAAVSGSFSGNVSIAGDVAERLYIVGADGEIKDEANLTFDGSELAINGDLSAINVVLTGDLSTEAGALTAATGSFVEVSVSGKISIDGDTATRLYIVDADGSIKDESKLTFDGSELAIDGNLAAADGHFTGNVQVDGDLRVKGSMTYIDTQNMRVQDAFIYLATGSAGTTDSGIVLHGGAGADMDLVIGQDGGAGEVIFGKANRAPDGDGAMHEIELVPAWMSAVKLGGIEGAQSGSLNVAGNDVKLEAANDIVFRANGWEMDLMSAADYTLFDTNFSATSIVGALNELYAAGAGGAAKGNLALSDVTVDVLDFSAVGTLSSADHKFIDVYLNGVLLAPGIDVTAVAVDNVTLAAGVVSELAVDDVFTVVLRGAA